MCLTALVARAAIASDRRPGMMARPTRSTTSTRWVTMAGTPGSDVPPLQVIIKTGGPVTNSDPAPPGAEGLLRIPSHGEQR